MGEGSARSLKYPWALLEDRFVHISMTGDPDIQARLSEGAQFECPSEHCGSTLLIRAVNSPDIRPHFAHPPGHDCGFNPETIIHMAAKAFLAENPELWLPELRLNPYNVASPIIENARIARWTSGAEEERILGRWRADIVLRDQISEQVRTDVQMPFLIIQEEGEQVGLPPLVVEVVVTSRVDPGKIAAVQQAGWRMLEIRLGPDSLSHRNLGRLVTKEANRNWLAHPSWAPAIAVAKAEAQRKEEERKNRADTHIRRVQDKITAGRNLVHWDPTLITPLSICALDNQLHPHVMVTTAYQHWMAAAREWWRIDLLRQAVFSQIQSGDDEPILPSADEALEMVEGYVLKLTKTPTKAVLESMDLTRAGWGTPIDAVQAFLSSLVDTGFAERDGDVVRVTPYAVALAQRHYEIDRLLLPVFHISSTAMMAQSALLRWKNSTPEPTAPTRRDTVIHGGRAYDQLLSEVRQMHAKRFQAEYVDHNDDEKITLKPVPKSKIPLPAVETTFEEYLASVHEVRTETRLHQMETEQEIPETIAAPLPEINAVDEGLVMELRDAARKSLKTKSPSALDMMVELFLNNHHPVIGRAPRDHCTSRRNLEDCLNLLKIKYR